MVALHQTRLIVCLLAPENSSLSVQLHRRCLMFIRALDTCWTRLRVLHDQLPHVFMTGKDDAVELFGLCGERLRPAVHDVLTICIRLGLSAFVGTKMCNVLVLRVTSSLPRHRMNSSCLPTGAVEPPRPSICLARESPLAMRLFGIGRISISPERLARTPQGLVGRNDQDPDVCGLRCDKETNAMATLPFGHGSLPFPEVGGDIEARANPQREPMS